MAEVIGLQLKRADRAALRREAARRATYADWLYEIVWQVQNRAEQQPVLETAVPLSRLTNRARAQAARLSHEHGLTIYANLLPEMEALSIEYVLQAGEQLGWTLQAGDWFTTDALAQQLGVIDGQQRLLARLIEMLAEEQLVTREAEGWRVSDTRRAIDPHAQWEKLNAQYPAGHAELSILGRCGPQLAQALRGEVDPLQLLFPGGSLAAAEQMYAASPLARTYNALAAEALRELIDSLAHDRPLRVLEIGAGTGGTTASVLPVLPPDRNNLYVYRYFAAVPGECPTEIQRVSIRALSTTGHRKRSGTAGSGGAVLRRDYRGKCHSRDGGCVAHTDARAPITRPGRIVDRD